MNEKRNINFRQHRVRRRPLRQLKYMRPSGRTDFQEKEFTNVQFYLWLLQRPATLLRWVKAIPAGSPSRGRGFQSCKDIQRKFLALKIGA
jgi:hypothetical protein